MLRLQESDVSEGSPVIATTGFADRLAFLPQIPRFKADGDQGMPKLLTEIGRRFAYHQMGIVWPVAGEAEVNLRVASCGDYREELFPIREGIIEWLTSNPNTIGSDGINTQRRYALLTPSHLPVGLLWADQIDVWTDTEEALFLNVAHQLSRSDLLMQQFGVGIDRDRLIQRLNDGAILAGRMAHDFDNLWTGILGFTDLTLPLLPPQSSEHQYVGEVATIGQRGIQMTSQLHQFSRSGACKPMPTSVSGVVNREQGRLKNILNGRIRFSHDVPADLPMVALETGALQIVLSHLLDNAVESIANMGTLRIESRSIELSHLEAARYNGNVSAGSYVSIRITDSGSGIRDEVKRRLFHEPFYTTKPRHRGLGLAITYRILHAHQGGLILETEVGKGTSVCVVLPVATTRPSDSTSRPPSNSTYSGGKVQ
jgi:signal transduction histidine kinase